VSKPKGFPVLGPIGRHPFDPEQAREGAAEATAGGDGSPKGRDIGQARS
jgi:hypothetical protein